MAKEAVKELPTHLHNRVCVCVGEGVCECALKLNALDHITRITAKLEYKIPATSATSM